MKKYFERSIQMGIDLLLENGVDYVEAEKINAYLETELTKLPEAKDINQQCEELTRFGRQVAAETGDRDYFIGGGFGISGAISGAVKAKMLNVGTNALFSFGRALVGNSAKDQLRRFKAKLMREHDNQENIMEIVHAINRKVFFFAYDILVREGRVRGISFDVERATGKFRNAVRAWNQATPKTSEGYDRLNAAMRECIALNPYDITFYTALYQANSGSWDTIWADSNEKGILSEVLHGIRSIDREFIRKQRNRLTEYTKATAILDNADYIAFSDDDLQVIYRMMEHHRQVNQFTSDTLGVVFWPLESKAERKILKNANTEDEGKNSRNSTNLMIVALEEVNKRKEKKTAEANRQKEKEIAKRKGISVEEKNEAQLIYEALQQEDNNSIFYKVLIANGNIRIFPNVSHITYIGFGGATAAVDSHEYVNWDALNVKFINLPFDEEYEHVLDSKIAEHVEDELTALRYFEEYRRRDPKTGAVQIKKWYQSATNQMDEDTKSSNPMGKLVDGMLGLLGDCPHGYRMSLKEAVTAFREASEEGEAVASYLWAVNTDDIQDKRCAYESAIEQGMEISEVYYKLGRFQIDEDYFTNYSVSVHKARKNFDKAMLQKSLFGFYYGSIPACLQMAKWASHEFSSMDLKPTEYYYERAREIIKLSDYPSPLAEVVKKCSIWPLSIPEDEIIAYMNQNFDKSDMDNMQHHLNHRIACYDAEMGLPTFLQPIFEVPKCQDHREAMENRLNEEIRHCVFDLQNLINVNSVPWTLYLLPLRLPYMLKACLSCSSANADQNWPLLPRNGYGRFIRKLQDAVRSVHFEEIAGLLQANNRIEFKYSSYWVAANNDLDCDVNAMWGKKWGAFLPLFDSLMKEFYAMAEIDLDY